MRHVARYGSGSMKNPPHPGLVVLQECIEPSHLTITDAAAALGVTRNTLSELVNGKRGISPGNGRETGQGVRRHRARLAGATGPVRPRASPPRPHKAETAATRLTFPDGRPEAGAIDTENYRSIRAGASERRDLRNWITSGRTLTITIAITTFSKLRRMRGTPPR
jgi:hypothetical protein